MGRMPVSKLIKGVIQMTGRPVTRKQARLFAAAMILIWATQILVHQWTRLARGQDAPEAAGAQFVAGGARASSGVTLELKAEAIVVGASVKLKQVCRWSNADATLVAPLADLDIAHFSGNAPFQSVSLEQVRRTLKDAGANMGQLRFSGATMCTVSRSDVKYDEQAALQQWIDAREGKAPAAAPLEVPVAPADQTSALPLARADQTDVLATPVSRVKPATKDDSPVRSLRQLLVEDASVRLNLPVDSLQINFNPADDKILSLSEPQFKFNLAARRVYGLGDVAWDVTIITETTNKKLAILANARAWQKQVIAVRPVATRAIIQADDLEEKRMLVSQLSDSPLLTLSQCIGQESSREIKPGALLTSPMVNAVDLTRPGQTISVIVKSGGIQIKAAAIAMEAGTFGQSVRVKNPTNNEIYTVVLTGPQQGSVSNPAIAGK
jgi:flagella basal body P-ring formation protein FlgA